MNRKTRRKAKVVQRKASGDATRVAVKSALTAADKRIAELEDKVETITGALDELSELVEECWGVTWPSEK